MTLEELNKNAVFDERFNYPSIRFQMKRPCRPNRLTKARVCPTRSPAKRLNKRLPMSNWRWWSKNKICYWPLFFRSLNNNRCNSANKYNFGEPGRAHLKVIQLERQWPKKRALRPLNEPVLSSFWASLKPKDRRFRELPQIRTKTFYLFKKLFIVPDKIVLSSFKDFNIHTTESVDIKSRNENEILIKINVLIFRFQNVWSNTYLFPIDSKLVKKVRKQ